MNPPDTTSKEQSDMSTAGGLPPERPQAAPQVPKAASAEKTGHAVNVKDLNAYYGDQHAIKNVTIDFPANEVTALIGPVRIRQVDCGAVHQPDARGDPRGACRGERHDSTSSTSTPPASTSRPCAA